MCRTNISNSLIIFSYRHQIYTRQSFLMYVEQKYFL